eukprot:SAG11_NODE_822_length_7009_cov_7.776122_5_plen_140_part_00
MEYRLEISLEISLETDGIRSPYSSHLHMLCRGVGWELRLRCNSRRRYGAYINGSIRHYTLTHGVRVYVWVRCGVFRFAWLDRVRAFPQCHRRGTQLQRGDVQKLEIELLFSDESIYELAFRTELTLGCTLDESVLAGFH